MRNYKLIILFVTISFCLRSQTSNVCSPILINDSLFLSNISINYSYCEKNGGIARHRNKNNITKIDSVFTVKNNCLDFVISTSKPDYLNQQFTLVTDYKVYKENNVDFYKVKLIVTGFDEARAIKINPLKFDLSIFNNSSVKYLKFDDITDLIKIK